MIKSYLLAYALGGALGGLSLAVPASALECPVSQKLAQPGVLKETQAQIDQTAKSLSSGDIGAQVQSVIADLRSRYPNVENAELANYVPEAFDPNLEIPAVRR